MDRIILGDNQFFGINHMSEDKALELAVRFSTDASILRVIDDAYACGVRGYMFNTHARVVNLCQSFRDRKRMYSGMNLYPSMPYAHKYANAVAEKGIFGALKEFLFDGSSALQVAKILLRGGVGVVQRDMLAVMKLLVDMEMKCFHGLNVRAIFLQNIITDLLLGLRAGEVFVEFCQHVRRKYQVDVAFNTMNMPMLSAYLGTLGISDAIICTSINKRGYLMSPSTAEYERSLKEVNHPIWAMSVLASGAIPADEAIEYVCALPGVNAIVFGASSRRNIEGTCGEVRKHWPGA